MGKKIPVVDEQDSIIGFKDKEELSPTDIYRVAALWISNSKGQILLAKRSANKKRSPNKWAPAVAGTLEQPEYSSNILKEAYEELGILGVKIEKGPKGRSKTLDNQYFCQFFTVQCDLDADKFRPNPMEVSKVKWFDKKELIEELKKHPENFSPNMPVWVELFLEESIKNE